MRVATWNVNSVTARVPRLVQWLEDAAPDVVCLQETKVAQEAFPAEAVAGLGYEVAHCGQGRWNGVAVLSRVGLTEVRAGFDGQPAYDDLVEARALTAVCGPVCVTSVYVPNGREPDHPHYAYKLEWLAALRAAIAADAAGDRPYAVLGDFNVAPTDADVWDRAAFEGSTHVTGPERAAIEGLVGLGLVDLHPRISKGNPYTYWDYRGGAFHQGRGMRIDLVLANAAFAAAATDTWVDRDARKGAAPSDHAPLVVDLTLEHC
jgi:exodeoxyribonuclease-3